MPRIKLSLLALSPQAEQSQAQAEAPGLRHALSHMSQQLLDGIVREVHAEGYYADFVKAFTAKGKSDDETIEAIRRWAEEAQLKVGFSRDGNICVFELR